MSPLAKAVFVSTASSVLSGYDQGVIAAAMLTMRDDLALSGVQEEMAIGVMNIAAAGGGLVAGVAAEALGRKRALWLANIFFLVGSIAISLAGGFVALLIGRMLQGVGVGFALVVAPIFTAELVPAEQRGRLVSLGDVCTNVRAAESGGRPAIGPPVLRACACWSPFNGGAGSHLMRSQLHVRHGAHRPRPRAPPPNPIPYAIAGPASARSRASCSGTAQGSCS
jgi:MFS family permease